MGQVDRARAPRGGGCVVTRPQRNKHRASARFAPEALDALLDLSAGRAVSGWIREALRVGLDLPPGRAPGRDPAHGVFARAEVQVVLSVTERGALVARFPDRFDRGAFVVACATCPRVAGAVRQRFAEVL